MKPITFHIFVHDDVTLSDRVLGLQYFKAFTEEISAITGRTFEFNMLRNIPGVTNFKYASQNAQAVADRWMAVAADYRNTHNLGWTRTDRYILVTQGKINDQVLGAALPRQPALIASVSSYQVIAHEVGHSFTATHEDAEIGWNAWGLPCETYVYPEVSAARATCYRYTRKNREHIVNYLKDAP